MQIICLTEYATFGVQEEELKINPCEVQEEMTGQQHPNRWQLRCDSRLSPHTSFTIPEAVRGVSLEEEHKDSLKRADNLHSSVLQVSEAGVVVPFHQGPTGACVFVYVVKGCKTFYLVAPTTQNTGLFAAYVAKGRSDLFFGGHEELQRGCQKIVVKERQALIIPGRFMCMTETTGLNVAIGEYLRIPHSNLLFKRVLQA